MAPTASRTAGELDPARFFHPVQRHWPRLLAVAVLGGVLGLLGSYLLPNRYRAAATISAGIDYQRAEFLDEDADQHIQLRIQDLILSDAAFRGIRSHLADPGEIQLVDLRQRVRLTRVEAAWELAVTDADASQAANLANAWARSALDLLRESQSNALQVAELQKVLFEVSCHPQEAGLWVCDEAANDPAAADVTQELLERVEESYGIPPVISYGLLVEARPPDRPTTASRPALTVGGTLLGLLAGIGVVMRWPGTTELATAESDGESRPAPARARTPGGR